MSIFLQHNGHATGETPPQTIFQAKAVQIYRPSPREYVRLMLRSTGTMHHAPRRAPFFRDAAMPAPYSAMSFRRLFHFLPFACYTRRATPAVRFFASAQRYARCSRARLFLPDNDEMPRYAPALAHSGAQPTSGRFLRRAINTMAQTARDSRDSRRCLSLIDDMLSPSAYVQRQMSGVTPP